MSNLAARYPFWAGKTHLFRTFHDNEWRWHRDTDPGVVVLEHPIVSITPQYVVVAAVPDRYRNRSPLAYRDKRIRLSRVDLEDAGEAWSAITREFYQVERPLVVVDNDRIAELRRTMQAEHPDRGGDVGRFIAAQKEYQRLRGRP